jgi:hypothetical protein
MLSYIAQLCALFIYDSKFFAQQIKTLHEFLNLIVVHLLSLFLCGFLLTLYLFPYLFWLISKLLKLMLRFNNVGVKHMQGHGHIHNKLDLVLMGLGGVQW